MKGKKKFYSWSIIVIFKKLDDLVVKVLTACTVGANLMKPDVCLPVC